MFPIVVLVRPQMGENIGMSARAMGNCGFRELRIVSPRDGWPSESALSAARGAVAIVEGARMFGSVGAAVADCSRVLATSARVRDRNMRVYSPEGAALSLLSSMRGVGEGGDDAGGEVRCCVLFGPENNGLENEDISYADGMVRADLATGSCSMNLAMAVFLFCWEWRRVTNVAEGEEASSEGELRESGDRLAERGSVVRFLRRVEGALEGRSFYRGSGSREEVRLNLRALGMRAGASEQELRTLEGVLSALLREKRD